MAYTPWRFKRLDEQQWWIVKDFFIMNMGLDETAAANKADELGRYMDMVWE